MRLKYTVKAKRQLKLLTEAQRVKILNAIVALKQEPLFSGEQIRGSRALWRVRKGIIG